MKKTLASAVTAVLLAISLASIAFAAPAAAQHAVPFKGTLQAQETVIDPGPPTVLHAIGSGNASLLGRYAISYDPIVSPTFSATTSATFVAANGDTLTTVGTGQAIAAGEPGGFDIVEEHTITGGTGRFAGATGSFTLLRHLNVITLVTSGTFNGSIVLAH
jgi:hypothetical protein